MDPSAGFPIGCLVTPRRDRCYVNARVVTKYAYGRVVRHKKVWTGSIRICEEENRERPRRKSRILPFGASAVVIELGGTERYPLLKLLTVIDGSQWIGWVIAKDVEATRNNEDPEDEEVTVT